MHKGTINGLRHGLRAAGTLYPWRMPAPMARVLQANAGAV